MKYLLIPMLLLVAACSGNVAATAEEGAEDKLKAGQVALIATAPDGTKLWGVYSAGRMVYFSNSGTSYSYTQNCGKNCTRTVDQNVSNSYGG